MATDSGAPPQGSELQTQLLPETQELTSPDGLTALEMELLEARLPRARLKPTHLRRASLEAQACALLLLALAVCVALLLWMMLARSSSINYSVTWFTFALIAPVTWFGRELAKAAMLRDEKARFVTVKLQTTGSRWDRCLMEALIHELRKQKALSNVSEAVTETGDEDEEGRTKWQVSLVPLLIGTKLHITNGIGQGNALEESWEVIVNLQQKDPVVCGRAQEPRRSEVAQLKICIAKLFEFLCCGLDCTGRVSLRLLQRQDHARSMLASWLQAILEQYTRQKAGQVQVYELQEEYKECRPSWELIREESCCSSGASGLSFYAQQPWAERVRRRVDFALGHGGKSRLTLFVSGPKGSGKTVFVEWLAGELRAPIYYIDLRSPGINDAAIRDCTARNRLRHSPPVLFHLDEFQAPLQQWLAGHDGHVSIQGLQSMLEGISTPNSAVFIFTSSEQMPALDTVENPRLRDELKGLLRRFQCQVSIPALDKAVALKFLLGFIQGYIEVNDPEALQARPDWKTFAAAWRHWNEEVAVPFDMLSKYAEQAVRDFYIDGDLFRNSSRRVAQQAGGRALLLREQIQSDAAQVQEAFLAALLDANAVEAFAKEYAGGSQLSKFQEEEIRRSATDTLGGAWRGVVQHGPTSIALPA